MLVTKKAKTVTNILKLSPTHFVTNIDVTPVLELTPGPDTSLEMKQRFLRQFCCFTSLKKRRVIGLFLSVSTIL